MIALPALDELVATYPATVEATQVIFRNRFNGLIEQTKKFQAQWEEEEPKGEDLERMHLNAVINMGRDLAVYREHARNVADGYRDGRFDANEAIERTNSVLADLTGLRQFFHELDLPGLSEVERAKADVRVEVLQEEITTRIIRNIDAKENKTVIFDPTNGGLSYKG